MYGADHFSFQGFCFRNVHRQRGLCIIIEFSNIHNRKSL
nr:MAG TPA: hypothetical protein [Caudoviricetes sp.]